MATTPPSSPRRSSGIGWVIFVGVLALGATAIAIVTPTPGELRPTTIAVDGRVPASVALRQRFNIDFEVRNVGDVDVEDLGIKINRGYIGGMVIVETNPRASFDDEATAKRFYVGPLARGDTRHVRITVVPTRSGEFVAEARFTDGRRLGGPLTLLAASGQPAEWTGRTTVRES